MVMKHQLLKILIEEIVEQELDEWSSIINRVLKIDDRNPYVRRERSSYEPTNITPDDSDGYYDFD